MTPLVSKPSLRINLKNNHTDGNFQIDSKYRITFKA